MYRSENVVSNVRHTARFMGAIVLILSLISTSIAVSPVSFIDSFSAFSKGTSGNAVAGDMFSFIFNNGIFSSLFTNFLTNVGPGTKIPPKKQFERVVIKPDHVTVLQGEVVNLVATAYQGNSPVSEVQFQWKVKEVGSDKPERYLGKGTFTAKLPGVFLITAYANGLQAQSTITVRSNPGLGISVLLRKNENELTAAQRALIEKLKASGALKTGHFDSRDPHPTPAGTTSKRTEPRKVTTKPSTEQTAPVGDRRANGHTPITKQASSVQFPLPEITKEHGPNAGSLDLEPEKETFSATAMRRRNVDPLRWDSGNATYADDRINLVGRPEGSAPDAGAGNGNFVFSTPVVSLPGRGIDVNLDLVYNARLWQNAGATMMYDADAGYPAPGWNLGFGRMSFLGASVGCMLVAPDGSRHSSAANTSYPSVYSSGGVYQVTDFAHTTDGSLIDFNCVYYSSGGYQYLTGSAKMPNGTTITYGSPNGDYDQLFPTRIEDASGNYIDITYVSSQGPSIDTITDTLGRTITFNYDTGHLSSITGPGYNGTTRTYVRLHHGTKTLGYNFGSMGVTVPLYDPYLIDAIYYPDTSTGYWLPMSTSYSSYGMISQVTAQRGMTWNNTGGQGSFYAGTTTSQDTYNFPATAGSALSDAPTYTTLTQTWDGMTNNLSNPSDTTTAATTSYAVSTSTNQEVTVTRPDGNKTRETSDPYALLIKNEILNSSNSVLDTTEITMESGYNGSTRPKYIDHTDNKSQKTRTELVYGTNYNQITNRKDYKYWTGSSFPLYREHHYTYQNGSSYINNHIFNLVATAEDWDASSHRLTKTEYTYDGSSMVSIIDDPSNSTAIVHLDYRYNPDTYVTVEGNYCYLWDPDGYGCSYQGESVWTGEFYDSCDCVGGFETVSGYDSDTFYRGNLTRVKTYTDAATPSGDITYDYTYDVAGNQRTATTNCCQQIGTEYTVTTQYSQPYSITKGSSNTSSSLRMTSTFAYDTNTKMPTTVTDLNGLATTIAYDSALRPTVTTLHSGATKTVTYNDSSLNRNELVQKSSSEGSGTVSNTTTYFTGRGQVNKTTYQAGVSSYNASSVKYDAMGRQWMVSQPYDTGASPSDWTTFAYDYLSRMTSQTIGDGSTTTLTYNSGTKPSSASTDVGTTVKTIDAWGRERWTLTDAFGRLVIAVEPNPGESTASVTASNNIATTYDYDELDRLTTVTQGSQTRAFKIRLP